MVFGDVGVLEVFVYLKDDLGFFARVVLFGVPDVQAACEDENHGG